MRHAPDPGEAGSERPEVRKRKWGARGHLGLEELDRPGERGT